MSTFKPHLEPEAPSRRTMFWCYTFVFVLLIAFMSLMWAIGTQPLAYKAIESVTEAAIDLVK